MTFPFLQLLFNSLIIGSIYALVAVGFSLIYSTNRFMHFAHGASVVIAGYALFTFFHLLHLHLIISILLTLAITMSIGYLMHLCIYKPLQQRKSSTVILLISSIALLILAENLILLFYGADVKSIGLIPPRTGISIGDANITVLQIFLIVISVILLIFLYLFLRHTRLGRNLRAVADNKELAAIMGLNTSRLLAFSFVIGSLLAGIAGILIGLEQNLNPMMGTSLMIKGFSGAVIGGIFSVPGSILGSYIVGGAENFGTWYLPSGYKDAITFTLLFLFLLFKPAGLFGMEKGVKA
ncbi:branched-chain amino acid ABC transporter permease [Candidatus Woesearchaeota archaeon]|nr:branched-chain amino acid ABC transporter permease [Candidatus Woesearchaeota archaeon]